MVFANDVEDLQWVDGSMEKYVKVSVKAHYSISQGISNPFEIKAIFVPKDLKIMLVDSSCASCSGQGPQAVRHQERVFGSLEAFRPGLLQRPEVTPAGEDASTP